MSLVISLVLINLKLTIKFEIVILVLKIYYFYKDLLFNMRIGLSVLKDRFTK